MATLNNYNGHYCEWEFEETFISLLEGEDWQYLYGDSIPRTSHKEVLYMDDLIQFLKKTNPDLDDEDILQIAENVRLVGSDSDFATLHKVYGWMVDGMQYVSKKGVPRIVKLIDFENTDTNDSNIYRVVNQFTV